MDQKSDVLDAWIAIEQLSEGTIDVRNKKYHLFNKQSEIDFEQLFSRFISIQEKNLRESKSRINFQKIGLVLFFDIFDFQEIIDILRKKYNVPSIYDETVESKKFTFALYFDKNLNFVPEKLFFTISGYIRYKKELPEYFYEAEKKLQEDLAIKFEKEKFNDWLGNIFKQYKSRPENCRYAFLENLDLDDVNLHSFYIDDLELAKSMNTRNLQRYFEDYTGNRVNLDSNIDSEKFNPNILEEFLQPKNYPLGRFPSYPEHALSFMQQVAVNIVLNEKETMRSVNGPPGTGKTTLLRDVIAELIVNQANEICCLSRKDMEKNISYKNNRFIGKLSTEISDKSVVIASSNNGALQNVVNQLPQLNQIADEFRETILEADYFTNTANENVNKKNNEQILEGITESKWGTFSIEGGNYQNRQNLFQSLKSIDYFLEKEYVSNPEVYREFEKLHQELVDERHERQRYYERIKELPQVLKIYELSLRSYQKDRNIRVRDLEYRNEEFKEQLIVLLDKSKRTLKLFKQLKSKLDKVQHEFEKTKNEYNHLVSHKPKLIRIKKIFRNKRVEEYLLILKDEEKKLAELLIEKREYESKINNKNQVLETYKADIEKVQEQKSKLEKEFKDWEITQKNDLENLGNKKEQLLKLKAEAFFDEIDFSKPYEELQKSNPWFSKEYRIKQSKLFIKALEVRKQFLYENRESFSAARKIFKKQYSYMKKENGLELVSESWQWVNFSIPVISTTFASFRRMFMYIGEEGISNLFIDEAGQALPQASVGAIFRSKKILAVGDPSQIKPVLTLDSNVMNLIRRNYRVNECYVSPSVSTQTLIDSVGKFGFEKTGLEWIGIPLWVHRRSKEPMFTIANKISYNGMMVQGKSLDETDGCGVWVNISGKADDKFVKEQSDFVKAQIIQRMSEGGISPNDIYVITPFKNVAYRLVGELTDIGFLCWENGKPVNVGTVHTFQGKEAKIVYLILGADISSLGAAAWVVKEPNIINVAATRAKEELYIVGDQQLYSRLGSSVADTTMKVIQDYNRK